MILSKPMVVNFIIGCVLACLPQQIMTQSNTYQPIADSLLTSSVEQLACVGIAAGFSVEGETKWQDGAGYMEMQQKIDFTPTTKTRIASISKPITAVAILQLYEQKQIDLDVPIQNYFPEFPEKKEGAITIRHLLGHTSGIDAYASNKERENQINYKNLTEATKVFQDRKLLFAPGSAFSYTTYGYVVLGVIIERVTGLSYEDYVQAHILDKLEMTDTGIEYAGMEYANKTEMYHLNSKGKIEEADGINLSDRVPGGGFYSTVTDMLKFGNGVLSHTLIQKSTLDMMFEDPGMKGKGNGYGLGWYLYGENPNYGQVYGHSGAQTGASAFLMLLPAQQTAIVVLSNTSGAMQQVTNITINLFDIAAMARA